MFLSRSVARTKPQLPKPRLDAVTVKSKRFGHFPSSFTWRGKLHHVDAVERCWTIKQDRDKTSMYCFRVRTAGGKYVLQQDLKNKRWYIRK